jgi:hypothetical protein
MPVAKIHLLEGQYDEARLDALSRAIQNSLISALDIQSPGIRGIWVK